MFFFFLVVLPLCCGLHPPRSSGGRIYTICKKRNTCRFGSFGIGLHKCRVYASDRGQGIYDTLCIAVQEGDFQAEARDKPAVAFCALPFEAGAVTGIVRRSVRGPRPWCGSWGGPLQLSSATPLHPPWWGGAGVAGLLGGTEGEGGPAGGGWGGRGSGCAGARGSCGARPSCYGCQGWAVPP